MSGDSHMSPLARYRAEVAALEPDHRFGRTLALINIAIVLAAFAIVVIPLTVNVAFVVARGGTPLDPECLAEHFRRYCLLQASWEMGPVDLSGWALLPLALASVALMILVWPKRRHYLAVRPARPVVVIVAVPLWFGMMDLGVATVLSIPTPTFAPGWEGWAAEFLPSIAIWAGTGVVGILGGVVSINRDKRRAARK